ncbi:esterase/lipase family protein [Rubrimonas cliftonensis]|uniref:PGAP1-like protein n=1 Tax=Rubrimonas cliftonensis TaxID=89524 RepID=A0A1H4AVJ4_9RHOB|nr:hypothetical protein [Rubrimonas cliftonensis]SEA39652.1 hypothetical protein SAMN05444370_104380 [Rubrimonas cliftonensis]
MSVERLRWHEVKDRTFIGATDETHEIHVVREALPIVLVPGIMGSRLRQSGSGDVVWDPPDGPGSTVSTLWSWTRASGRERKRRLIGDAHDPGFLEVDPGQLRRMRSNISGSDAEARRAIDRGWGGVHWSSYGGFLRWASLAPSLGWPRASRYFTFPVYAIGYNWSASNRESGDRIARRLRAIVAENDGEDTFCEKVIVVSHSMGGLASRSAMMLHGAEDVVAGAIHTVQPVTGAAATYKRMRAGFEGAASLVLGWNAAETTPVLANSPGGLELLPNKGYRDNAGRDRWLSVMMGGRALIERPLSGDPYAEIYRERHALWRMVDEALIDPGGPRRRVTPWMSYLDNLAVAESFHDDLALRRHPVTYTTWGEGRGHLSWDRATWTITQLAMAPGYPMPTVYQTTPSAAAQTWARSANLVASSDDGVGSCRVTGAGGGPPDPLVADIEPADGEGDGTVPAGSGRALPTPAAAAKRGVEHQMALNHPQVRAFLTAAIQQIVFRHFGARTGP